MENTEYSAMQQQVIQALNVTSDFDASAEIERRVAFLAEYISGNGLKSLVLGISGGIDSTVTGRLCQLAIERVRGAGREARFLAVRLPYGVQRDESDAQQALQFIRPDDLAVVDIKPAADAMLAAVKTGGIAFVDANQEDFVLGNIKARQRMIAQYALAGRHGGVVIGTDHAAEALMGFFTKFGDGAADVTPLSGLTKRRVRALGTTLGAPASLVDKIPTADLESLIPGKPDEDVYGITYENIDDFLEGKTVTDEVYKTIFHTWRATMHKRALPVEPGTSAGAA
ncbi:MAG: ammonia-dependent NAD(+) synthetase [Janthinobacterium lividum]